MWVLCTVLLLTAVVAAGNCPHSNLGCQAPYCYWCADTGTCISNCKAQHRQPANCTKEYQDYGEHNCREANGKRVLGYALVAILPTCCICFWFAGICVIWACFADCRRRVAGWRALP